MGFRFHFQIFDIFAYNFACHTYEWAPRLALTCCCPRYGCNKYANSRKLGAGEKPQNVVVSNFIWLLRYTTSKIICKEGSANVHFETFERGGEFRRDERNIINLEVGGRHNLRRWKILWRALLLNLFLNGRPRKDIEMKIFSERWVGAKLPS